MSPGPRLLRAGNEHAAAVPGVEQRRAARLASTGGVARPVMIEPWPRPFPFRTARCLARLIWAAPPAGCVLIMPRPSPAWNGAPCGSRHSGGDTAGGLPSVATIPGVGRRATWSTSPRRRSRRPGAESAATVLGMGCPRCDSRHPNVALFYTVSRCFNALFSALLMCLIALFHRVSRP